MGNIGVNEQAFLQKHFIPERQLFDLQGRSVQECREIMKPLGKLFGYNARSCTASRGHSLVSRRGHCIQCDPAKISFMRRDSDKGDLYLVGSLEESLIKIGTAYVSIDDRISSLNSEGYGGATDWTKLVGARDVPSSGAIEGKIHAELKNFKVTGRFYQKNSKEQEADEIFSCSFATGNAAFRKCVPKSIKPFCVLQSVTAKYNFPDRPR
ncbi:MAG: GIY-YIG nuclease family protein [Pirellulaceae bacterium]